MIRRVSMAILVLAGLARLCTAQAPDQGVRTSFAVRYVGRDGVYLEGGRNAGLAEGMKLVIRRKPGAPTNAPAADNSNRAPSDEPGVIAHLTVMAVADNSAACHIDSVHQAIVVGDSATLERDDAEKLVDEKVLSNTRQYPAIVSFTEGDPMDEEVRAAVPRPPSPAVNRASGRIGFDYSGTVNHGQFGSTSSLLGMVVHADITRIGGTYWNLSGYWRGSLQKNSFTGQQTIQDLMNRTYHMSLTYANPNSAWVAGFGRMYLPWASSLDTIDGAYFGRKLAKRTTAGVFAGTTPDPTSWTYDPNRRIAGSFVNWDGGTYDGFKYSSTVGLGLSMLGWRTDRPFLFTENTYSYKRVFSIYSAVEADRPRTDPSLPAVGAGIGHTYTSVSVQPTSRLTFELNHNYFRDVPTFDPQLIGTGLLDKYLFQGFSGGVRAQLPEHLTFYTNVGRSTSSHDTKSSWNTMFDLAKDHIWRTGLRVDLRYSRFNSAFAQGSYRALGMSREFGDGLRLEVQGGSQSFVSPLTRDNGSRFFNSNLDVAIRTHYFLEGGFTLQRGGFENYDQWHFTLGYRFDNRHPKREAFNAAKP